MRVPRGLSDRKGDRIGRLDQHDVGSARGKVTPDDRLVPESLGDPDEQVAHFRVRLGDQDLCHRFRFSSREGGNRGWFRYEAGMKQLRVLVVDDDPDIRRLVCELFGRAGYATSNAPDGRLGLRVFYEEQPDLVLLDVGMPELDGWHTLERIRDLSDVPVVMLTARASELEKVRGLQAGADDYVTKPFGRQELLARAQALLRRAEGRRAEAPESYADSALEVDFAQRQVAVGGAEISLTPLEFKLLGAFVRHPNQVLTQEQLLELVWGDAGSASRDQVKLYVGYLRRKLGPEGAGLIETVRGFGYRYRAPSLASHTSSR